MAPEGGIAQWAQHLLETTDLAVDDIAGYKYPRIVQFVDALPMTSTGKILKRELS